MADGVCFRIVPVFYQDLGQVASRDGLAGAGDHVAAVLRARRPGLVVIDSFKALRVLAGGDAGFRTFLHRLAAFPAASLWVGEYQPGEAATAPEFAVADAITVLAVVPLGQREKRFLHVRKLRGGGFLAGRHGYRLTPAGVRLFPRLADITPDGGYPPGGHRITTGIGGLDAMTGGGLWPGPATMVAGPSGSGKTIMGLHFISGGAARGEPGIIATLQEDPARLDRMRTGLGWPAAGPAVEVLYRSPADIYIDERGHDLLAAAGRTQARRVLIDSLADLQIPAIDDTRFREFMYSLTQRFSRQGITLFSTYQTPGPHRGGRRPASAISHLADNVITLGYHLEHGTMSRSVAITKTRASSHDPAERQFSIGAGGISLGDAATPGPGTTAQS